MSMLKTICGRGVMLISLAGLGACHNDHDADTTMLPATPVPSVAVLGSSEAGLTDGALAQARFSNPVNVEVASDGTVYVADYDNDAVRRIRPSGQVDTLIKQANFQRPFGLTLAPDGKSLFVQTDGNDKGERNANTGTIWKMTLTGEGALEVVVRDVGRPRGLLALADGRIALSDPAHHTIRVLNPTTKAITPLAGQADQAGFADATGTAARFSRPYGMALSADGALLVADQNNHRIRKVTLNGVVTTYAGTGVAGAQNGAVANATFNAPQDVAAIGNTVYVADHNNFVIRKIHNSQVSSVIGNGSAGFIDAQGTAAAIFGGEGMALTPDGRYLWLADGNNGEGDPYNRVRYFVLP